MLKLKLQYFGHLIRRADSLEKTLMLGKDWRQEEKGTAEDEMVGWQHWLNGHELEQTLGDSRGQGSLACYSPPCHKESDSKLNNKIKASKNRQTVCSLKIQGRDGKSLVLRVKRWQAGYLGSNFTPHYLPAYNTVHTHTHAHMYLTLKAPYGNVTYLFNLQKYEMIHSFSLSWWLYICYTSI